MPSHAAKHLAVVDSTSIATPISKATVAVAKRTVSTVSTVAGAAATKANTTVAKAAATIPRTTVAEATTTVATSAADEAGLWVGLGIDESYEYDGQYEEFEEHGDWMRILGLCRGTTDALLTVLSLFILHVRDDIF